MVFAVPALESSAFVGFLFPGEIAVLLGGVLAYEHRISLIGAIGAAVAGAVIGDSIGYEIGHRWGRRVLDGTLGRLVNAEHLDRAERYLATRGGKAVFLGRFTAALRVLVPGMAGMAGLDYPTFLAYNAAGGALWATGFSLLGFAAGKSWRTVEHVAKRASLVLLLAAVLVGAVVLAARWAISHQMAIRAFGARQLERPWLVRGRQRYRRPLDFLAARLQRGPALGLSLTISLAVVGLVGWGFGAITQDVVAGDDAARLDRPILAFFVRHREPWLTSAMRAISYLGSGWVLAPAIAVVGLVWWARRHRWRPGALLAGAYLGSLGLFELVKQLARRPRPPALLSVGHFAGYSFPSGHATQAVAVWERRRP